MSNNNVAGNSPEFHNATIWDSDFSSKNHNETDYDAFKEFQKNIDEKYSEIERKRLVAERKHSLEVWDNKTPERWRGASLSKIANPAAAEVLDLIKEHGYGSFFLSGDAGSGKTYIGYAIIRKLIGAGIGSFSNTLITSEDSIVNLAYTGFDGRNKFEKLLDSKNTIYLFDNVGSRDKYNLDKEGLLWEQLIDHIYSNSLYAIFTGPYSLKEFSEILTESGKAKLLSIVNGRSVSVSHHR